MDWTVSHAWRAVAGMRVFIVVGPTRQLRVTISRIVFS